MTTAADNLFSLDAVASQAAQQAGAPALLDLDGMCLAEAAANTVSYHWNIASDTILWSANAAQILGVKPESINTGRKFAGFLSADNITSRYDTVMRGVSRKPDDAGAAFEIEYQFKPDGRPGQKSIWIEDHGRWFAGEDHQPSDVFGTMKVANERHLREQELNFLSTCDTLTGMMNRARMMDALDEAIRNSQADKNACAFAILAVNNLDVMNEAYGFEVADEVIVALAERLRRVMRVGDSIARYSGSKFGIILNACKPGELTPALERFMKAVRDSVIETRFGPVWALLSIGAVSLPALGETAQAATAHAEEALSEALRLPSDGHVIYTSSEERKAQRLLNARCATEIINCLRDGLFKLAFQPVIAANTGAPTFHEALLRMSDMTGATITAGHLVPIAERLGLIRLIDRAVLQQAISTLQAHPSARISVNISATTANDPRWYSQILELLAEVPEIAQRLIVEVTETTALGELETSREFVRRLKEAGCGIAIDDFGAGFTSYRNLKELPITIIKLDGHFCRNLAADGGNAIYVKSMVDLAHAFGITVVAEWVESAEDAQVLARLGVDLLQGNFIGMPQLEVPWKEGAGSAQFEWQHRHDATAQPVDVTGTEDQEDIETPADMSAPADAVAAETVAVAEDVAAVAEHAPATEATPVATDQPADDDISASLDLLKAVLADFQKAIESTGEDERQAKAS